MDFDEILSAMVPSSRLIPRAACNAVISSALGDHRFWRPGSGNMVSHFFCICFALDPAVFGLGLSLSQSVSLWMSTGANLIVRDVPVQVFRSLYHIAQRDLMTFSAW